MPTLRLLLLEDDPLDAELIVARLEESGIETCATRVETREAYLTALERDPFDLILADYALPAFDGSAALSIARERCSEVPFLVVSGSLGEERAIEILKSGATDYVLKQRLERLVPAVRRALHEARERAERRRLEAELRQRAEDLAEQDRRKDEFLAMLAHELRNPLGAISSAVQLLRQFGPQEPCLERAVGTIERQLRHQIHLVDDLLDVSRITRGKISLQREWLDLGRLVRQTVGDHLSELNAAGLAIRMELPEEPVWIAGDVTRLCQVLGNLLENAAKFTESGGSVTVCLTIDEPDSQAVVAIRDTGIGIDPQMQHHVFECFTQADRSLDRRRGGLGLGLALVKGLVELHGGAVGVASAGLGRGAEFTFTLPLAPCATPRREDPAPRGASPARRVLVVEDNRDAAETLRDLLELCGHEVVLAFSGPAGVDAARRFRPEVVLCDIGLPGCDGYEVAQAVRRDPTTAETRLIAISGYGREEDRRRAQEAGFDVHLTKPVNFAELEGLLAPGAESS